MNERLCRHCLRAALLLQDFDWMAKERSLQSTKPHLETYTLCPLLLSSKHSQPEVK